MIHSYSLLFTPARFRERPDRHYFDDIDEYMAYLIRHTRLRDSPEVIRAHELAHTKGAQTIGATSVKYYTQITYIRGITIEAGAYTQWFSPVDVPNIAFAAIAAAPRNPGRIDMEEVSRKSGYRDVGHLRERIEEWNNKGKGIKLPLPGELEE